MKLTDRVSLVASGGAGFDMTHSLDCHVYLIDGGSELALVDAGIGLDSEAIVANIRSHGFDPAKVRYVFITHGHADHAGGAAQLRQLTGCEVLAAPETASYLRNGDEEGISLGAAKRAGFYPEDYRFEPCEVARELREGDVVALGDLDLQTIETPGHCSGHLCYQMTVDGTLHLFGGDCIFSGGRILLQNIYDCQLQEYLASIRKLAAIPVDVYLPGHTMISLQRGSRTLKQAAETLDRLAVPLSLF